MKKTAHAPSNIAFIKYWGKKDNVLRLPLNSSFSMNLDGAYTITTVDFSPQYNRDTVQLIGGNFSAQEEARVVKALERIRLKSHTNNYARVLTQNTFPKGAGAAASASGFAALTVAAFEATGMSLSEKELTIFARMGSGSACRSIPDGFVLWEEGNMSENSYAHSLYPSTYWDLRDALVIVDSSMKKVSTTEGMESITTSPFLSQRLKIIPSRIERILNACKNKNLTMLGEVIEEDCLDMHHVMQTQIPALNYWNNTTVLVMEEVKRLRSLNVDVYFTVDAGPNVHCIYEGKDESKVLEALQKIQGIETIINNKVTTGTHLIDQHLF